MKVLVVAHEASRTGAPKSLLELCSRLKVDSGFEFIFVFYKGGILIDDFKQIGKVYSWENEYNPRIFARVKNRFFNTKRKTKRVVKNKLNAIDLVYFNTIAHKTDAIHFFTSLNKPVVTHVRELQ